MLKLVSLLVGMQISYGYQEYADEDVPAWYGEGLWSYECLDNSTLVKILLEEGADPNELRDDGYSLLWRSVNNGSCPYIIEYGKELLFTNFK